jgi:Cys-rich repeat protein
MNVAALVIAILAAVVGLIPFGWYVSGALALVGVVLAVAARRRARSRMAVAALVVAVWALVESVAMYAACTAVHRAVNGIPTAGRCWNDGDCRAWGGGHCVDGSCHPCRDDGDCRGYEYPHCWRERCVECVTDAHCAHVPGLASLDQGPRRFCAADNQCAECRKDGDCPAGKRCRADELTPGGVRCAQ